MYRTESIWGAYAGETNFSQLEGEVLTETLIIGAGITGISLGMELALAKRGVIVIDERKVGGGTTGHSTGNLYVSIDQLLSTLRGKYSMEVVKAVVEARRVALNRIRRFVDDYELACDFQTSPWFLYSVDRSDERVEKELETARELGLMMNNADLHDIPYPAWIAASLSEQAQVNPMKYVQELAKVIPSDYCKIYENTAARKIEKKGDLYEVTCDRAIVKAKNVVHASHTPKGVQLLQTLLGPYREYGIAFKTTEPLEYKGIFWGYHKDKKYSTRTYEVDGERYVLLIGNPHKVGQRDNTSRSIIELESFARKHFEMEDVAFRWGGQHYRPADLLPYIGHKKNNIYVATGYSTDGLVYGTLAGLMIKDQITEVDNAWTDLFDPSRVKPIKSAANFLKENVNVAKQYIELLPGMLEDAEYEDIAAGEGKVIEKDGHKLAVFRNADRKLHIRSAVCTHLGCIVSFNDAEQSWDCPCHGSRFKVDGNVIEGPALSPLSLIKGKG